MWIGSIALPVGLLVPSPNIPFTPSNIDLPSPNPALITNPVAPNTAKPPISLPIDVPLISPLNKSVNPSLIASNAKPKAFCIPLINPPSSNPLSTSEAKLLAPRAIFS